VLVLLIVLSMANQAPSWALGIFRSSWHHHGYMNKMRFKKHSKYPKKALISPSQS
jgi:hypothetical protein